MIKKIEWSLFLDAEKTDFQKFAGLFKKALNFSEQDHSFLINVNGVNVKVSGVRLGLRQTASYNKIGFAASTSLLAKDSYLINEHMEKVLELVEAGMPEIARLKKSMTLFMDDELMDKKEFIRQPVLAKASVKEKACQLASTPPTSGVQEFAQIIWSFQLSSLV